MVEAQPCGHGHSAKPLQTWLPGVVSLGEVASFALCKLRGMGWVFWQVEIRKVVQCCWQLLGLVTAQTFLKGLSKSWRTLELPSRERQVVVWAAC